MKRKLALTRRAIAVVLSVALVSTSALGNVSLAFGASSPTTGANASATEQKPAPTVVRELTDERTETSKSLLLSNGYIRTQIYSVPQFYRDEKSGGMLPIDASLKKATIDGRAASTNGANSFDLTLPDKLSGDWVSVETSRVALSLRPAAASGRDAAPLSDSLVKARSATATGVVYTEAYPGATLEYESKPDGLKETIVVSKPTSDTAFGFDLRLEGAMPRLEDDGSISITPSGESTPSMSIPRPFMFDARETSDGSGYSDRVRYELSGQAPLWHLVVIADAEWTNDPARIFPVRIDPTVDTLSGQPAADTYVRSDNQSTNYSGATGLWVNDHHPSYNYTMYSLLQPGATFTDSLASKAASGYKVVAARMSMKVLSVNTAGNVRGARCTSSVNMSTVAWATKPSASTPYSDTQASANPESTNTFDMTEMTKYWQDNGTGASSATVLFQTLTSGARLSYKSLENSGTKPLYAIDYAPVPTTTLTSPLVLQAASSAPQASWTYAEALGNPQAEYQIEVSDAPGGGTTLASANVSSAATSASLPVPSGGFQAGGLYYVRVRTANSPSAQTPRLWSAWSAWGSFELLSPVPDLVASTSASSAWFTETDSNGDFLADNKNDSNTSGRGAVDLSWGAVSGASGYDIFLSDGKTYRKVGSTTSTSWSTSGKGIYPSDTTIAGLAQGTSANPFAASGALDLRDDPRALYAKTAGSLTGHPGYYFLVGATYSSGTHAPGSLTPVVATLENRTLRVCEEPQHAEHELGSDLFGHAGAVRLDDGSLQLDVTDLAIASWGPEAALSRHYSSANTAASTFAPGWRFTFERTLVVSGNKATYADETGDAYKFVKVGSTWISPNGMDAWLTPSGNDWQLTYKDRSVATFSSAGVLKTEADASGNTMTYDRAVPGHIYIKAANGQQIDVAVTGNGVVTEASYTTAAGTRTVTYNEGAGYTGATSTPVRYYPNTSDEYVIDYLYGSGSAAGRLIRMRAPDFEWYYPWRNQTDENFGDLSIAWNFGYDSNSKLASWKMANATDYRGLNTISYGTRTATVVYPYSLQVIDWNQSNTLSSKSARNDQDKAWTTEYGPSNAPVRETTPLGASTESVLDAHDNVISETDQDGDTTKRTFDSLDRVATETDPRSSVTTSTYTGANLTAEERTLDTQGSASRTEYTYSNVTMGGKTYLDALTQERKRIDASTTAITDYSNFAASGEAQTTVSNDVRLSADSDPVDLTSTKAFDAFGNLTNERAADGSWVAKDDTYTISGRLSSSEVVTGTVTTSTYNALGGEHETYTTAGGVRVNDKMYVRDAVGTVMSESEWEDGEMGANSLSYADEEGRVFETWYVDADMDTMGWAWFAHDAEGNVTREWPVGDSFEQPAASLATRISYDAEGNTISETEPGADSDPTETDYTVDGEVERIDEADGSWVEKDYDEAGNEVSETKSTASGSATSTNVYDLGGRLTQSTDEAGGVTNVSYDLADQQVSSGIPGHGGSSTVYNTLGWVLSQTDGDGIVTKSTYDAAGRVTSVDTGGEVTSTNYDGAGRADAVTDPDGAITHTVYDAFSRVTREYHEAGGETVKDTTTTFDAQSRPAHTSRTVGGALRADESYTGGILASSTLAYGETTSTVTYSTADRTETQRTVSGSGFSSFTRTPIGYDAAKRELGFSLSTGLASARVFDGAGRVATQTGSGISGTGTYSFDAGGRKSAESLPYSFGGTVSSSYAYTDDGRLSQVTGDGAGTFAFDGAGNVATYTAGSDSGVLHYDATTNRLTNETVSGSTVSTYTFDTLGRRRAQGPTSNPTSVVYSYHDSGGLRSYDTSAGVHAAYDYDASGQRTRSVVTSGSVTTTATWTYEGLSLLSMNATPSAGAACSIAYLYDSSGRPYAGEYRSGGSSTVFGIVTTDRGDVVALTTSAGASFAAYRYDAWGRPLSTQTQAAGSVSSALAAEIASRQPLRYAGYCFDSESGLYYLSARTYDPSTMQFLQKDPARADGEESAYQYCGGDPVGKVDPSGELGVSLYGQEKSNWCMPAALKMVIKYITGKVYSQAAIHKAGTRNTRNTGMTVDQTKKALHAYGIKFSYKKQPLSADGVKWQISHGRPVLVASTFGSQFSGNGHVSVIRGYYRKYGVNWLQMNDPAPVYRGAQKTRSYSWIRHVWYGGWYQSFFDLRR